MRHLHLANIAALRLRPPNHRPRLSCRFLAVAAFLCGLGNVLPGFGAEPFATVIPIQGESQTGSLRKLSTDRITISTQKETREFPTRDVWELRFNHKRMKPHLWGSVIFLANGDRLVALPETIDDTAAVARWRAFPNGKPVRVPLETISGFILKVPEIAAVRGQTLRAVLNREQKTDLVDLKNGDQASGEFLSLTKTTLRLNSPVGETPIARDSIRLVTMNRELISFPKTQEPTLLLSLTDGSRITASEVGLGSDERIKVKAVFGAMLDLPLSAIMSIRFMGRRAVYLSDLRPAKYEHQPYLAGRWELKTDRNVLGEPLRLDGIEYPKGLGMHSQSVVSYDLNGAYQTFRAVVGVDDAAASRGSVVFVVEVDGKKIFESKPQSAKQPAITLPPIPLGGAKRLTLRVKFAEFADVLDYANWCEPLLIRP